MRKRTLRLEATDFPDMCISISHNSEAGPTEENGTTTLTQETAGNRRSAQSHDHSRTMGFTRMRPLPHDGIREKGPRTMEIHPKQRAEEHEPHRCPNQRKENRSQSQCHCTIALKMQRAACANALHCDDRCSALRRPSHRGAFRGTIIYAI